MRVRKNDITTEAEKERLAGAVLLALKTEDGAMIQGPCRWALEMGKGKEVDSSLEFPERMQHC